MLSYRAVSARPHPRHLFHIADAIIDGSDVQLIGWPQCHHLL
jgi:hypothetical protein